MADKRVLPAVAGKLIGAICAAVVLLGIAPSAADAATVGCGRVTTFVAPGSAGALDGGDGWVIFAKADGTSDKVIVRAGTFAPSGGMSGYVCIAIDGVYLAGVLAPGAAGYVPEPAGVVTGTGVYCGTVAVNPFTSGQISGPRTLLLHGALSAFGGGVFRVPASMALPAIGSYLCARFELGGPSQLVAVLQSGDPGYVAAGLPNSSTDAGTTSGLGVGALILAAGLALLAGPRRRNAQ